MLEKSVVESVEMEFCVVINELPVTVLRLRITVEHVLRNEIVETPPPKEETVLFTNPIVLE